MLVGMAMPVRDRNDQFVGPKKKEETKTKKKTTAAARRPDIWRFPPELGSPWG